MEVKVAYEKQIGIVSLLIGIIIFILALSADFFGWGEYRAFGYRQAGYLIAGIIFIICGVSFIKQK
jgi:hypothetical protein